MPRILVIDGNTAETRAKHVSAGGTSSGEGYVVTLKRLKPELECDIVRPADEEPNLPDGIALKDYAGAAITGCWGLQVGVTAAGGSVVRNPRGREFGFGRRITLTHPGRDHGMFVGKPEVFEACTVHVDTVETLPANSTPLAHNDMGLQAAEIKLKNSTFWGVQYHPEYSCAEIAAMARRYADVLIRDGLVKDPAELDALCADLTRLHEFPSDARLAWRFGVGEAITDPAIKLAELRNWLERQVFK